MHQMPLPMHIDEASTIVGCPILTSYFDEHLRQCVEVVGGRLAGEVCFRRLEQELTQQLLEALAPLRGKRFNRYHTLESALRACLGDAHAMLSVGEYHEKF